MLLILMVILIICLGCWLSFIIRANILYGAKACTCDYDYMIYSPVGPARTSWKCNLCGHEDVHGDTGVPELCDRCAFITGRCAKCGNIKK